MREHRLYQVDFLLRKYGFKESDIVFEREGNLSLATDPKQVWADRHPEIFPVNVNAASKFDLLKVPGLGLVTIEQILKQRAAGRIRSIEDIGKVGLRLKKANQYLVF
jgi:predicted DNA-binding helix-hairpin-helix protein